MFERNTTLEDVRIIHFVRFAPKSETSEAKDSAEQNLQLRMHWMDKR